MNVFIFSNVKNLSNKRGKILLRVLFITKKYFSRQRSSSALPQFRCIDANVTVNNTKGSCFGTNNIYSLLYSSLYNLSHPYRSQQ